GAATLQIVAEPVPGGLARARRLEAGRLPRPTPYAVPAGRALAVSRTYRRVAETRVYWVPRAGVLVTVRVVGLPEREVRRVVHGLRVAA
ncbi:MAG TPA: hypothetical protein VHJ17_02560, partial [Thermomonospora sp.]|nr:hypothetical protein [Thermomonospora sp.]